VSRSCLACGANLLEGQERCDLCGTPAGANPDDLQPAPILVSSPKPDPSSAEPVETTGQSGGAAVAEGPDSGAYCNSCGWQNPPVARFCSKCGARLQDLEAASADKRKPAAGGGVAPVAQVAPVRPASERTIPPARAGGSAEEGVGKRVGIIVGSAVMVVLALYLIGVIRSGGGGGPQAPVALSSGGSGPSVPLAPGVVQKIEALDDSLRLADGESRLDFMRQKVELYLRAGRYDLAGASQEEVARETLLEVDWVFAGNLLYDQMERSAEGTEQRTAFAKKTIAAYQEALTLNPDNLDVRTDMAVAYLSDPDNPMGAIQETQAVLSRDSLHIQANFNRGIMLSRINRLDEAIKQFRKVQRIIDDPEAEIYIRAQSAIDRLSGGPG
jgi:zinc ribbon protein